MSGSVYFVAPEALFHRDEDSQLVKIGYTRNSVQARLSNLQTGSPIALKVYVHTDGSLELERAFHEAFSPLRDMGEWFFVQGKLWDFLHYFNEPYDIVPPRATREQIEVALFDSVLSNFVPHSDICAESWLESASFAPLARFYPNVLAQ